MELFTLNPVPQEISSLTLVLDLDHSGSGTFWELVKLSEMLTSRLFEEGIQSRGERGCD